MRGWLDTFADQFFELLDEGVREKALDYCIELLQPSLQTHDGKWFADYVRMRFTATID
ncbi:MAG: hypothetical protein R3A47_00810 [Polyangiales bacterium]